MEEAVNRLISWYTLNDFVTETEQIDDRDFKSVDGLRVESYTDS